MQAFEHFTPDSLDEALELLARFNGRGYMLAGGTDLMLKMKAGMLPTTEDRRLEAIINIKRLPELKVIAFHEEHGLRLGALTTLRELTRSPIIRDHYPSLAQAAGVMASEQIRSFATVGGNLCNASPSADLAPPLMALEGVAIIATATGERQLPLAQFFLGPGKSALAPGELLKELILPPPTGDTVYLKHSPRAYMDIAVVGVAARLHLVDGVCQQARIVLAAVAPVPLAVPEAESMLRGKTPTPARFEQAARIAAEACSPIDDIRGAAWYRRRMVEVLTRRALQMVASTQEGAR